jgi:hypothetical protein
MALHFQQELTDHPAVHRSAAAQLLHGVLLGIDLG